MTGVFAAAVAYSSSTAYCESEKLSERGYTDLELWDAASAYRGEQDFPEGEDDVTPYDSYEIISGSGNRALAMTIAQILEKPLVKAQIDQFADGEISIEIKDNLRGKDVFIIQPTSPTQKDRSIHDNLMELLLLVTTARRASAHKVIAVVPYYGYARHDRIKPNKTGTISAADTAILLQISGCDQVISVDLHKRQLEGFFDADTTVENLEPLWLGVPYHLEKDLFNPVIVSPSSTGVERAKKYMTLLKKEGCYASMAFMAPKSSSGDLQTDEEGFEQRPVNDSECQKASQYMRPKVQHRAREVEDLILVGDVSHSDVVIIDDMIDTGTRVSNCANFLKKAGAKRIFAYATHGIFSAGAIDRIEKSALTEVLVTDTNEIQPDSYKSSKVKFLSVAPLMAEAIRRVLVKNSLSSLTHINILSP